MPHAKVTVNVALRTNQTGRDVVHIEGDNLPPNREYTVFLLEQAGAPFGAAEYIGDLHANAHGHGENDFKLIVQEAFTSTLVGGQRVRVDLNRVGMWFADPKDDDFCLGANSPVTPFDCDNEAGVQAFNSATAVALPRTLTHPEATGGYRVAVASLVTGTGTGSGSGVSWNHGLRAQIRGRDRGTQAR